jgi:hypothetical protein
MAPLPCDIPITKDHRPINLLDEILSWAFDKLGSQLEADDSVRVVVSQSAVPDFFMAHSGLGRVGTASKRRPAQISSCSSQERKRAFCGLPQNYPWPLCAG